MQEATGQIWPFVLDCQSLMPADTIFNFYVLLQHLKEKNEIQVPVKNLSARGQSIPRSAGPLHGAGLLLTRASEFWGRKAVDL